jgi:hypothetical protein
VHHRARLDAAPTPGRRLDAALDWLRSEAFHAGPHALDQSTAVVLAQIEAIRHATREERA